MFERAFRPRSATPDADRGRAGRRADLDHLREFAAHRSGVEAYLEPATPTTGTTLVLVAASGEWTRRRIADAAAARALARRCGVPLYDAALLGYPARMRAWNSRRSADSGALPGLGARSRAAHPGPPAGPGAPRQGPTPSA